MARLPTTSCWCQSIDTRSSMKDKLKRIANWSSMISAGRTAIKFMLLKLWGNKFTCSCNFTRAFLYQESFNPWKEAVPIGCSSFILNWKNAIGEDTYGQAANSFGPLEMWLLTRYLTILKNLKGTKKQSIDCANQRIQDNEDSMISEFRKTWRAARSIPRPLGRGGRAQFDFICSIKNHRWYPLFLVTPNLICAASFWNALLLLS